MSACVQARHVAFESTNEHDMWLRVLDSHGVRGALLGLGLLQHHAQRMRPYSGESTPSRPIWEVKHQQAQLVLR